MVEHAEKKDRYFEFTVLNDLEMIVNVFWYNFQIPVFYSAVAGNSYKSIKSGLNVLWCFQMEDVPECEKSYRLGEGLFAYSGVTINASALFEFE